MIEQFKERREIILKRMEFIREFGEFIESLDFQRLPPFDFFFFMATNLKLYTVESLTKEK